MGPGRRVWEAVGGAVALGILCGLALGGTLAVYLALSVVSVLGGVLGGTQHAELEHALLRGLTGGTAFGLAVLAGYELGGGTGAVIALPHPAILFLLFTIVPAFALHALGHRIGLRLRRTAALAD